jgi:tight adherence protein C
MADDLRSWIVVGGTFMFFATIIMIFGSQRLRREQIRGRLAADTLAASDLPEGRTRRIIKRIDDKFVGLKSSEVSTLRFDLVKAGYFSLDAPKIYTVIRAFCIVALPLAGYTFSLVLTNSSVSSRLLNAGCLTAVAYLGPIFYIRRRKRQMSELYRNLFPDLLDLLVVCIDAGLSFDAALVRVEREFKASSPEFATNLALLSSEMRSGRSVTEALDSLSERLGLDEARSFSTLIKQSLELGSDIGDALRTYADEMRDKRRIKAEEKANRLPVKLTFPIAGFIFPVVMIVILTPVVLKITDFFASMQGF